MPDGTAEAVASAASRVASTLQPYKSKSSRWNTFKKLLDLISQLEIWIRHQLNNHIRLPARSINKLENTLSLLKEVEDLLAKMKQSKLPLKKLWFEKASSKFCRSLEECLANLIGDDGSCSDALVPCVAPLQGTLQFLDRLPVAQVRPKRDKLKKALAISKLMKEAVAPVPVAGTFLSSGFSIVVMLLERRKKAKDRVESLQSIVRLVQSEVQCLYNFGVLVQSPCDAPIIHTSASSEVRHKVHELEMIASDIMEVSREVTNIDSSQLQTLSQRIKQYQISAKPLYAVEYHSRRVDKRNGEYLSGALVVSIGFFFGVVRK